MKTILTTLILALAAHWLDAQSRIASTVTFPSGDETIEGILVRPQSEGRLPAVVFQQGSGNHAFDGYETEAWGPHKFYIEDVLLAQGYAVLYCNKRGLGNTTGNWRSNDFYGRAEDAYAAVTYLKTREDIDPNRIGVSGHSQGGWVAQLVASQHDDIAFVLSMAGPTVGVRAQTEAYDSLMYLCQGYSAEELGPKMAKYRKRKKKAAAIGRILPFIGSARHWNLIYDYETQDVLSNLRCPTLLLFAEHDVNVPPEQNITYFNDFFDDDPPANFTIKVMQGGQHGFYQVEDRCVDWATAEKQPFDPAFQREISQWVESLDQENQLVKTSE